MINTQDQEELFKLISEYLKEDITCIAIGGTAMMFTGYKNTTKDIDLIFKTEKERNTFIQAIQELGYSKKGLGEIYDKKRKENKNKPIMYSRGEERFDLFVENVFGFKLSFDKKNITQKHDFIGKNELSIHILDKETLILLKAITGREKDHEDIETILNIEKNIDWNKIVEMAIEQKEENEWILIDLEETLKKIKKKTLIKQETLNKIYKAQKEKDHKL